MIKVFQPEQDLKTLNATAAYIHYTHIEIEQILQEFSQLSANYKALSSNIIIQRGLYNYCTASTPSSHRRFTWSSIHGGMRVALESVGLFRVPSSSIHGGMRVNVLESVGLFRVQSPSVASEPALKIRN